MKRPRLRHLLFLALSLIAFFTLWPFLTQAAAASDFFLHSTTTDFLDNTGPTATATKFKDSTGINFTGGNPWRQVGTWRAAPALSTGTLISSNPLHVWLGLKNSDDQGTQFDLQAELYRDGALVAKGLTRCITGVTRNPDKAKEVTVLFDPFTPVAFNGTAEVLSLRIFTRVGTNPDGSKCPGHSNAVGLRLYYDAINRASRFGATFTPVIPSLQVSIAAPAPGSVINRSSVLVLGEITVPLGAEVGVTVNGIMALVSKGQFAALVPVDSSVTGLTATATNAQGASLGSDTIAVTVEPPASELLFLNASPANGPAPLTVNLRASFLGPANNYQWDVDGNGTIDLQGSTLAQISQEYLTPGLYFPAVIVTNNQGSQFTETVPLLVFSRNELVALLQAKWQSFKDALRAGNTGEALQFITQRSRNGYQEVFQNLTVPLSQIDHVLTNIQFVQFRPGTAEFEMLRTDERGELSYLVRFVIDQDGIWRIKDM